VSNRKENAMRRKAKRLVVSDGPQRRILETLKLRGPLTARELSDLRGGGTVAMRAHLRNLLAAGLVAHEEERQSVGRPVRRHRLTPAADGQFPKHYDLLAVKLAETVAAELGHEALVRVLRRWLDELHPYLDARLPGDFDARLQALAKHQSSFGFMASVRKERDGVAVVERNCPVAKVASRFPQICDHEAALFERVLDKDVELGCCQARGDALCEFRIGTRVRTPTAGVKAN
jgi:predicted ArsR family transcriptional regulator